MFLVCLQGTFDSDWNLLLAMSSGALLVNSGDHIFVEFRTWVIHKKASSQTAVLSLQYLHKF